MGLRFRKSFKLAPGIRMNLSGSGLSCSIGPRGASVTVGKRGTYVNVGIPGTGLYTRQRVGTTNQSLSSRSSTKTTTSVQITVGVKDDGTIFFNDQDGNPLDEKYIAAAKRQQGDVIKNLIQQKCNEINTQIESLAEIHFYTPDPKSKPIFEPEEFTEPQPPQPIPQSLGFFASLFKSKRERLEQENLQHMNCYNDKLVSWQYQKSEFEQVQLKRKQFIEKDIYSDTRAMESYLEENLQSIVWPRETIVSAEILENGELIFIDVDLPEVEEMPNKTASVPQRGYKLSVKDMSPTQVQRLYMSHVHAIGFRIIGETFTSLQNTKEIILSAFSQRSDSITGKVIDEYLYSVRLDRNKWSEINFGNLKNIDVLEALAQFDLRRNISKTGVFKAVQPFGLDDQDSSVSN